MFIVDSIPVIDEPDKSEGTLANEDIDHVTVITSPDSIKVHGYSNLDKLIIITTKEYAKRPVDLKRIPSTKIMEQRKGVWHLKGATIPYSGRFIDYFYNGKIKGDGILKEGVVDGLRTTYYLNGNKSFFRNYVNGIADGYSEEYFINGAIKQKGTFKKGLDDGIWQDFYSTGELKRRTNFVNLKAVMTKEEEKFYTLQDKSIELMRNGDYSGAIKKLNDAILLNNKYADVYFNRGTAKLNNLDFDNAIVDFDKALELEPLYMEALANRAFARIRKYQFKDGRTLSKTSQITVVVAKDKVEVPLEDKNKICNDLAKSLELGDTIDMIFEAIALYCK